MSKSCKPDMNEGPASGSEEATPERAVSDPAGDVTAAIKLLEPGKPFVMNDGLIVTDNENLILCQYVDIRTDKLHRRPATVLKFTEAKYGLEYASEIQLSAPHRFQAYGETFIQDDQEGHALRETKTESSPRTYEEHTREQEKALALLGEAGMRITKTEEPCVQRAANSMTFGKSSWIYCTAMETPREDRNAKREKLSGRYDHESVIRQPRKFALALGEMFANQQGAQGKEGHFTHPGEITSLHEAQIVMHGPVCYTDDVLGFLESRQSDPLYQMYPLFVKHNEYRDQQEYRFVLHCETPAGSETLRLKIAGAMRDALSPPHSRGRVTFQRSGGSDPDTARLKASDPKPTHLTLTRTGNWSNRRRRALSIEGNLAREEIISSEQTVVLKSGLPVDALELAGSGQKFIESVLEAATPGEGKITESETRERRVDGELTDRETTWQTRVFTITQESGVEGLFTPEVRNNAAEMLNAVGRPFENFSALPKQASEALKTLASQTALLEGDLKVQTMSACWNAIWAICNLCECYGDVVGSVGIEEGEFVAIALKQAKDTGAEGKIVVGPKGTFAYVLTREGEKRPGYGGAENRLVFFPDEEARAAFEEFGWTAMREESPE